MSQKNNAVFLTGIFMILTFSLSAQKNFRYMAAVGTVDSTGFCKIVLKPDFIAKCSTGFSDIRLQDDKGNFIPYIRVDQLPLIERDQFTAFPQISSGIKTDTGTTFIIENKEKTALSRVWIKLKSTAVKRTVNLSGSDDLKNWFGIDELIPLQADILDSNGTGLQSLTFPASNYRYLKLLVNDRNKAPVKFLQAGIYKKQAIENKFYPILNTQLTKKDSGKVSLITIKLNDNYLINCIRLSVTSPQFYKREVAVYDQQHHLISTGELTSSRNKDIYINARTNLLELSIENGDNRPLNITGAEVLQTTQFIVSYLEAGKAYKLLTGDTSKTEAPLYDLKFFTDSIKGPIPAVESLPVSKNPMFSQPIIREGHNYSMLLWIAIVIALLLLSLLTLKMTKDVNNKSPGK